MKLFLYAVIFLMFSACCMTGNRCDEDITRLSFNIVDFATNQDLVFGASKIYNSDSIKFFSVNGNDTTVYLCKPQLSVSGRDSCLLVDISMANKDRVFLRLNDSDVDTLKVSYVVDDGGPCCGSYKKITSVTYNNNSLDAFSFIFLRKKN